jgi:hypothetical protein
MLIVDDPGAATETGLNEAEAPDGSPVTLNDMLPVNPPVVVTVVV